LTQTPFSRLLKARIAGKGGAVIKLIALGALLLVGIFWALRRRPKVIAAARKPLDPPAKQHKAPHFSTRLHDAITALTEPGLRGSMTPYAAGPTDSRIGGPLIWPKGETLPLDETGRAFILLAQVDLSTLPAPLDLPRSGLLQILITADEMFGCEFPSAQNAGMRVVLHPADASFAPCPNPVSSTADTPITVKNLYPQGQKIAWEHINCPPSFADSRLSDLLYPPQGLSPADKTAVETLNIATMQARGPFDIMLRGTPDFVQSDPRQDPAYRGMVNLIAFSSSGGAYLWGDAGEACFLIPKQDIAKAEFSRVIYYWDCR
jgi:uncharacterized protein YwqG